MLNSCDGKIHEECGVFGAYSDKNTDLASLAYYGLYALQHRGQESCGIVIDNDGLFKAHLDAGLVSSVFDHDTLESLGEGNIALGHVRYAPAGLGGRENAQPMVVNHVKGAMALAHNGNITNSLELRTQLELEGAIFHSKSDTEVISYIITKERLNSKTIEDAVLASMDKIEGAYSMAIMSPTKLIAVRDKHGMRPLCYGVTDDGVYIVASESCALDAVNARLIRDVEPGEVVVFGKDGVRSIKDNCGKEPKKLCVFEYVYFARPDSIIDGCTVNAARVKAGKFLAQSHPADADVVIGCPDSGLDAAIGYSVESGIPFMTGFIKNKYIGRTFIAPGQKAREDLVRIKLNPVREVVEGKRVVLVDDSIVRGTTSKRIVKVLREAGAKEVHMRISSPEFLNPCYYGTDIDSKDHLISCKYNVEETARYIGADSLGFLSIEQVCEIAKNEKCDSFCTACFDGKYPTRVPEAMNKSRFEKKISEKDN